MTLIDAPDLLTVPEAAAIARVGRNAMYSAVTRGDVYAVKIGASVRIPKVALERWLLGPYAVPRKEEEQDRLEPHRFSAARDRPR